MAEASPPRIFLAHAHEDYAAVATLYDRLKQAGYHPWLDKKDLIPGQNWKQEIPKAIKSSALFIACLSQRSIAKQGYVQREFRLALKELAEKPPGTIYLIPLRLDPCDIPDLSHDDYGISLGDYHWLDYFEADGFARLDLAIKHAGIPLSQPLQTPSPPIPPLDPVEKQPAPQPSNTTINNYYGPVGSVANQGTIGNESGQVGGSQQQGSEVANHATPATPEVKPVSEPQPFQEALPNGVLLDMVYIKGGQFFMGYEEKSRYQVTVPAFYMGKYPITQRQWKVVASLPQVERELKSDPSNFKGDNRPVETVSWYQAIEFCKRLSQHAGKQYRLPSEAEWEYACRAGTQTRYSFGDELTEEQANFGRNIGQTTPVGQYPANGFGLYDMHGNVLEWCEDVWHPSYEGAPADGSAWTVGSSDSRLLRGGSWIDYPRGCRSAYRSYGSRDNRLNYFGFRVCCVPPRASS